MTGELGKLGKLPGRLQQEHNFQLSQKSLLWHRLDGSEVRSLPLGALTRQLKAEQSSSLKASRMWTAARLVQLQHCVEINTEKRGTRGNGRYLCCSSNCLILSWLAPDISSIFSFFLMKRNVGMQEMLYSPAISCRKRNDQRNYHKHSNGNIRML